MPAPEARNVSRIACSAGSVLMTPAYAVIPVPRHPAERVLVGYSLVMGEHGGHFAGIDRWVEIWPLAFIGADLLQT